MSISALEARRMTREIGAIAPVVPVVVMNDTARATPLADALVCGGFAAFKAMAASLSPIPCCPTVGISSAKTPAHLTPDNVKCDGRSWVASKGLLEGGHRDALQSLAHAAGRLDGL